jgi:hypothetical protein
MSTYLNILIFIVVGFLLLWFGYTLFFSMGVRSSPSGFKKLGQRKVETGLVGDPQTCPVCSARLREGELVMTSAYPSITGEDRLMHIKGCLYCVDGERERVCPVCGASLFDDEILIARMFERRDHRPHVHIQGCSRCKTRPVV